jgi:hypothetical protein
LQDSLLSQSDVHQIVTYEVSQKGTDEEKNHDELFLLLRCIKDPDFVTHEDPHEQIRVACCLAQLLEVLPFTSLGWQDEDFVVSCFIIWFYCSADFLGH